VATGDLIPIFLERGCDMVIAALGILKAGGAYVPLDFDYPRKRLAYMLEDMRATRLVTSTRCLNRLPEYTGEIICLIGIGISLRGRLTTILGGDDAAELSYCIILRAPRERLKESSPRMGTRALL
jgi:non-ribosomal peptide synthetase component F